MYIIKNKPIGYDKKTVKKKSKLKGDMIYGVPHFFKVRIFVFIINNRFV
jgi:hypothetical protein